MQRRKRTIPEGGTTWVKKRGHGSWKKEKKRKRNADDAGVQGEVVSAESQRRRNRQSQMIRGVIDDITNIKNMGFRVRGTF